MMNDMEGRRQAAILLSWRTSYCVTCADGLIAQQRSCWKFMLFQGRNVLERSEEMLLDASLQGLNLSERCGQQARKQTSFKHRGLNTFSWTFPSSHGRLNKKNAMKFESTPKSNHLFFVLWLNCFISSVVKSWK